MKCWTSAVSEYMGKTQLHFQVHKLNKPLGISAFINSCHGTQVICILPPLINFTAAVFEFRNRLCSVPVQSAENESRLLNLWSPLL